jgi:hypothetical protein
MWRDCLPDSSSLQFNLCEETAYIFLSNIMLLCCLVLLASENTLLHVDPLQHKECVRVSDVVLKFQTIFRVEG